MVIVCVFYHPMKLKSFLKRLFTFGETLEIVKSPINGEIKVVDDLFGDRSMIIGGVSQSGGLVTKLWETAIKNVPSFKFPVSSCLILGLGCGNAAKIVADKFPGCKIIGVEIDPKVVEIGKKYFRLGEVKNLKIITGDAIKYIENLNHHPLITNPKSLITKYDLIIVDLYLGQDFLTTAETKNFIHKTKSMLSKNGLIIFNRLYYGKKKKETGKFSDYLKKYFNVVKTKKTVTNLLIYCQTINNIIS